MQQKVLIVDDSPTNLVLLDHVLRPTGCVVIQATTGIEAVALVADDDFALILLDIQMPGMNGYEAAMRIKELPRGRHVPIIFITAIYQDEDNVRLGYETGAVDYLFRPVNVQTLTSKVQVFLEMNRQKLRLEREIETRLRAEAALRQAEAKYRAIFERAVEGIFQCSPNGEFCEVNPAMARIFGYESPAGMIGVAGLRQRLMAESGDLARYMGLLRRDGYVSNFEFRGRRLDGDPFWCSESARLVVLDDGSEMVEGVLEDITGRKQTELELKHLASVDSLTGVYNRHLFFDRIEHALVTAKRAESLVAVLFIDLDDFKRVNDTYGHQAGDELLRMVAGRLKNRIREADTLARLGGDEFGVLLECLDDQEGALTVARSLLEVMNTPYVVTGESIRVGATVGISFFPEDGKDGVSLISRADSAMYGAKRRMGPKYGTFRECGVPR
ncbi:GGDEF domain-containing response regulator [Pseudodesulfovibrio pelocollis]|uniref:GGDEF domain-containing response regulator n=1 Tax=Pseudodesulfovibrio pelocollis TaxID=3051432 RepID=UPI00255B3AA7|nr:diguanylate cyclase [Pseudodesulfovibrio sp. SB368]